MSLSETSAPSASPLTEEKGPEEDRPHVAGLLDMSHELRTPTHAILGHVELMLSGSTGPLSADMRASLGEIQRAAITLSHQIARTIELAETIPSTGRSDPDAGQ